MTIHELAAHLEQAHVAKPTAESAAAALVAKEVSVLVGKVTALADEYNELAKYHDLLVESHKTLAAMVVEQRGSPAIAAQIRATKGQQKSTPAT